MHETEVGASELNPWATFDEIFWKRNNFIIAYKDDILAPIRNFETFSDLTPSQQDNVAELVSRFYFGVHMAYHRLGGKYDNYILAYDINSKNEYSSFGFAHEKNKYTVKVDFLKEAAHLMFFNERGHMGVAEIVNANEKIRGYTSERENRAMKWKLAYTRRYFPQYYDSLKETADKATEARLASNNK